jgi:hypothetical protein
MLRGPVLQFFCTRDILGRTVRTLKALVDSTRNVALRVFASNRDLGMSTPLPLVLVPKWQEFSIYCVVPTFALFSQPIVLFEKRDRQVVISTASSHHDSLCCPKFSVVQVWCGAEVLVTSGVSRCALVQTGVKSNLPERIKVSDSCTAVSYGMPPRPRGSDIQTVFGSSSHQNTRARRWLLFL